MSERPVKKKRTLSDRGLLERVVRTSQAGANDERHPLELRAYYAGVALHFDDRLTKLDESEKV